MILTHGSNSLNHKFMTMPAHCILLDYLVDGYSQGIQAIQNQNYTFTTNFAPYKTSGYARIDYFKIEKTPFVGMPYAHFENNIGNTNSDLSCRRYSGLTKSNYPNGISVEFIGRLTSPEIGANENVQYFEMSSLSNFTCMNGISSSVGSYLYQNAGGYSLNYNIGYLSNVLTSETAATSWHHFAVTFDYPNEKVYMFLDGTLAKTVDNSLGTDRFWFYPAAGSMSNPQRMIRGYDIAQVAAWDYPKYKSSFTIPHDLLGWM